MSVWAIVAAGGRGDRLGLDRPKAFAAGVLRAAAERDADASDCAGLVEAAGGRVRIVPGDPRLLKVTTVDDLALISSWL